MLVFSGLIYILPKTLLATGFSFALMIVGLFDVKIYEALLPVKRGDGNDTGLAKRQHREIHLFHFKLIKREFYLPIEEFHFS